MSKINVNGVYDTETGEYVFPSVKEDKSKNAISLLCTEVEEREGYKIAHFSCGTFLPDTYSVTGVISLAHGLDVIIEVDKYYDLSLKEIKLT